MRTSLVHKVKFFFVLFMISVVRTNNIARSFPYKCKVLCPSSGIEKCFEFGCCIIIALPGSTFDKLKKCLCVIFFLVRGWGLATNFECNSCLPSHTH